MTISEWRRARVRWIVYGERLFRAKLNAINNDNSLKVNFIFARCRWTTRDRTCTVESTRKTFNLKNDFALSNVSGKCKRMKKETFFFFQHQLHSMLVKIRQRFLRATQGKKVAGAECGSQKKKIYGFCVHAKLRICFRSRIHARVDRHRRWRRRRRRQPTADIDDAILQTRLETGVSGVDVSNTPLRAMLWWHAQSWRVCLAANIFRKDTEQMMKKRAHACDVQMVHFST